MCDMNYPQIMFSIPLPLNVGVISPSSYGSIPFASKSGVMSPSSYGSVPFASKSGVMSPSSYGSILFASKSGVMSPSSYGSIPFASKSGGHVPPVPMGAPLMRTDNTKCVCACVLAEQYRGQCVNDVVCRPTSSDEPSVNTASYEPPVQTEPQQQSDQENTTSTFSMITSPFYEYIHRTPAQ